MLNWEHDIISFPYSSFIIHSYWFSGTSIKEKNLSKSLQESRTVPDGIKKIKVQP